MAEDAVAMVKKTVAWLADGREIIYFDESESAARRMDDPRELPATTTASEMRYDAVLDEWVVIASHRQSRTHLPPADQCPLDPSGGGRHTEIPADDYDVVVFENRFPSLAYSVFLPAPPDGSAAPLPEVTALADGDADLFARRPGVGRCEVVCFTPEHNTSFAQLPPQRVHTVLEAWIDRTQALGALPHVEQVFCFENRGEEIGVTLSHPHGQIYAYPFVTPRTRRSLDSARRWRERTWRNLFADVLAAEQRAGVRVVLRSDHWTAFVPAAARWPVELHLYPNRRVLDLAGLSPDERDDFCVVYPDLLRRVDGLYGVKMPYVAAWHQAPARIDRELAYLHLQLFSIRRAPGKLKFLAGSESGMGAFINDVIPEQVAKLLREATV